MNTFLWALLGGVVLGIIGLIVFSCGKKRSSTGIILSICLSIACVIMFGVYIAVESMETTNNQQSAQSTVDNEIDTSVTFADIYREFKRNELNAKDLYNGNRYQITAEIDGMKSSGLLNLTGGATLTMKTRVDNTIVYFLAEFEKEQEEALKQISVGDTITFTGTCSGGSFSDCEIQ